MIRHAAIGQIIGRSRSLSMLSRSSSGQSIVAGALFLVFFSMLTVGLLLLLYGTGSAEYSQKQIFNVADTAARAIVRSAFWDGNQYNPKPTDLSPAQQQMVSGLLADLGYTGAGCTTSATMTDDGSNCIVTVTVKGVPLKTGGILPINKLDLSATAAEPWSLGHPPLTVMLETSCGPTLVPAWRPGRQNPGGNPGDRYIGCPPMQREYSAGAASIGIVSLWNFGYLSNFNPSNNWWGGGDPGINVAAADYPWQPFTYTGAHWCAFAPYSGHSGKSTGYSTPPVVPTGYDDGGPFW
jgi:hypothetical protein